MKPHLSWSQISMLFKCGESYRRRYLVGEIIPPGFAQIIGRATHKSVEANLQGKIAGVTLAKGQIEETARETVAETWKGGVRLNEGETEGKAIDSAVALSDLHYSRVAPQIQPKAVEQEFLITLENFPYDLKGYIDIEEISGAIRDTKTMGKSPPDTAADDSEQLTMYALAKHITTKTIPPQLYLDCLVNIKVPKEIIRATSRTVDDLRPLLRRIEAAARIIEKEAFAPCNPDVWWCCEKWCGYAETCPYFRKRVLVAP